MASHRISRTNPYILPAGDVEHILRSLPPAVQQQIAAVSGIPCDEWQALDPKMRVKHYLDWQNGGLIAASAVQTRRAYQDLADLADPAVQDGDGTAGRKPSGPAGPVQPTSASASASASALRIAQKAV